MLNIIVTREDVKRNITFYKFWAIVFFILMIISSFFKGMIFIYHYAGLFLALVYWYFNNRSLNVKGNIISKSAITEDSLKGSVLLSKATFVGWLVLSGLILSMIIVSRPDMLIDTFFFFIFVLTVLYKRIRLLSRYMKKK